MRSIFRKKYISKILEKYSPYFEMILDRIRSNPLMYRLASGAFWSLLGTLFSRVFTTTTTIIIARILGKESYGELALVLSTISMFGILAGFGLANTSNKYVAEFRKNDPKRAGRIITLINEIAFIISLLVMCIILLVAPWLSKSILNRPSLESILYVGSVYLFITTLRNVMSGPLGGFESFRMIARVTMCEGIVTPFIAIPLVYIWDIHGAVLSMALTSSIGYSLFRTAIKRECQRYRILYQDFDITALKEWPVLYKFSLPSMISGLFVPPVIWISNTILANQPNGYAELGLFTAANQFRILIMYVPQVLSSVMLPIFSESHGNSDGKGFFNVLTLNLKLTWALALPATLLAIIFRQPLSALFGKQYIGIEPLITLLMVSSFLIVINNVVGTALAGSGRMWIGATLNGIWAVALLTASIFLIPIHMSLGLGLSYLLAYSIHTLLQMAYVEFFLAPSCISSQYKLLTVSAFTLIPVSLLGYFNISTIIINFLISFLALFILYMFYSKDIKYIWSGQQKF